MSASKERSPAPCRSRLLRGPSSVLFGSGPDRGLMFEPPAPTYLEPVRGAPPNFAGNAAPQTDARRSPRRPGEGRGDEARPPRRGRAGGEGRARRYRRRGRRDAPAGLKAEDANTRIRSAVAILDRAWGRPRQAVEAAVAVTPTVIHPEVDVG